MAHSDDRLSPAMRPRTAARVAAVQAVFQIEQGNDTADSVIIQFVQHRLGTTLAGETFDDGFIPEADVTLFTRLTRQAEAGTEHVHELLAEVLPPTWPVKRLDPVLRSLFAVAITEMEEKGAPPVNVIINEYLDVAHGFFSGDEPKLVNGVLDAVAKRRAAAAQGVASSEEPKVEAELSEDGPVGHALTEAAAETDHSHDGQA
ncbi:transcription antitermination factor NusB [Acetobacter sicerae]|uniref:Transcription antitermination factor NusB n=1 Tax=Acetobacter sicerae TaxID=85325 RepID=A0ABS8W099_9PROT|nr:transcription antitermination factor NusB [Acetobacter sicerae]MCE0745258.1 transcription antitermination factor NusB [Acetobacter sicerae]